MVTPVLKHLNPMVIFGPSSVTCNARRDQCCLSTCRCETCCQVWAFLDALASLHVHTDQGIFIGSLQSEVLQVCLICCATCELHRRFVCPSGHSAEATAAYFVYDSARVDGGCLVVGGVQFQRQIDRRPGEKSRVERQNMSTEQLTNHSSK